MLVHIIDTVLHYPNLKNMEELLMHFVPVVVFGWVVTEDLYGSMHYLSSENNTA